MMSGRGAQSAANSTLSVPCRKPAAFSQTQPPWNVSETITTGADTLMRSSRAVSRKVCVPPPDSPVQPIRAGSTSGSEVEPVERADAVPGLERRQAQAPAPQAIVQEGMSERLAVVVADHVVHEDDAAELGPANTALLDLGIHSPVFPVSVRTEDRGHAAALIRRPVEVAAEGEAGKGLEDNLLDRVIVAIELAVDPGVERGLGKHRPEPQRDQHLLAEMNGPVAPGSRGLGRLKIRTLPVGADVRPAGVACRLDRLDAPSNQIKHRFVALVSA